MQAFQGARIKSCLEVYYVFAYNAAKFLMETANTVLFQPFQLGDIQLQHRIVMAPMTRMRCNTLGEPGELAVEYYSQRASTPGTLIIAEGSIIAAQASGYPFISGLWSNAQVAGWKKVSNVNVHLTACVCLL